jgi:hypothetical protein
MNPPNLSEYEPAGYGIRKRAPAPPAVAPGSEQPTLVERVRIHERMQQASALIRQVEDDLPHGHPDKGELKRLSDEVWEKGYELLGEVPQ